MLEFSVSFRVTGKEVDPEEISGLLKLQPSDSHKRGDPHYGKRGRYADFPEGLWALSSSLAQDRPLAEHLQHIRLQLQGREPVLAELRARGYLLDLFIGVFEIGDGDELALSDSELKSLADLQLSVCFDLYTWNAPE